MYAVDTAISYIVWIAILAPKQSQQNTAHGKRGTDICVLWIARIAGNGVLTNARIQHYATILSLNRILKERIKNE